MSNEKGPNIKKKQKCKNCEGKGLLKKGDRVVKCQRCKGRACGDAAGRGFEPAAGFLLSSRRGVHVCFLEAQVDFQ